MYRFILSLFTVSVLAAPAAINDGSKKIPVAHRQFTRDDGHVQLPDLLEHLNKTLGKYTEGDSGVHPKHGIDLSPLGLKGKRQSYEPLTDQDAYDDLYFGKGSVGNLDGFTFDFDTGSSDTFVPGPSCGSSQGCARGTQYDNSGNDQGTQTTITYGSGSATGENFLDDVTIAGLTAQGQNVVSLTSAQGFSTSSANSLIGLAFQSLAASGTKPFFKTLIDQGALSKNEFSFYLGRASSGTGQNSELTLGGRNPAKFTGSVTSFSVSRQQYWQIPVDGAKVQGTSNKLTKLVDAGQAAIDTGTTLVIAPNWVAANIFARVTGAVPATMNSASNSGGPTMYAYPCKTTLKISLTFGGMDFSINPTDLNFGQLSQSYAYSLGGSSLAQKAASQPYCLAAIMGYDLDPSQNLYIVGDTFLKSWYSIYSYDGPGGVPFVGFAKAK